MRAKINTMGGVLTAGLVVGHFLSFLTVAIVAAVIVASMYFVGRPTKSKRVV